MFCIFYLVVSVSVDMPVSVSSESFENETAKAEIEEAIATDVSEQVRVYICDLKN